MVVVVVVHIPLAKPMTSGDDAVLGTFQGWWGLDILLPIREGLVY